MTKNEYFNSREFEDKYHYEGRLGSFCGPDGTSFLLWAPTAQKVILNLYKTGHQAEEPTCHPLEPITRGVWLYHTKENLDGSYYTYEVTVDGITRTSADPYARACGVNGSRSMVLDLARTNPQGFDQDKAPAKSEENIIYEVHVKDFSWDASSGIDEDKRGRFAGLCQAGSSLNGDGIHPTCMDYLKQLGVTHVQLMPVYDFGSVDEAHSKWQFNWGYDPVNYNVPEGSYSSDPYHGEVRVRELKEAIKTLHENGFRVIMDVVYNHTYSLESALNRTVPGYYYRFNADGSPSNGSGCGNDTASERSMCAKYILDSVLYWAEEYHFDGFRFDLMGLLPVSLMNEIRTALDEKFGPGEKLLFGEPWRAADTAVRSGTVLAEKGNLHMLKEGVGAFCDTSRDTVKGNLMHENARGLINGGYYDRETFKGCVRGWAGVWGEYSVLVPEQTIAYVSCHDDWTLWDRLVNTLDESRSYEKSDEKILRSNRLAAALLFGFQGNLFLLSGEEFGRTKYGVKNSYASPIEINRLDWNRAWANERLFNYYKGLFALRRQLPCLCDKSKAAASYVNKVYEPDFACAAVEFENPRILLLYNFSQEKKALKLPEGSWKLLVNGTDSFCWKESKLIEEVAEVDAMSAMILGFTEVRLAEEMRLPA